jgi:CheY-like chemotaxis protein
VDSRRVPPARELLSLVGRTVGGGEGMADERLVVLVVSGDPAVRQTLAAMLTHHGFEPLPAADGAGAVAALRARAGAVRAAVLEVEMPGTDGTAVLTALRALEPDLPGVFLVGQSAYSAGELRARGATAVLAKPVGLDEFGRAVAAAVGPKDP